MIRPVNENVKDRDRCFQRNRSPRSFDSSVSGPWTWTLDISPNETKADAGPYLRDRISAAGADVAENPRRERLLGHLESSDKAHPLELAKYSLERAGASSSEMDLKQ